MTLYNCIDPYLFFKKIAFRLDPEVAHHWALAMASRAPRFLASAYSEKSIPELSFKVGKLTWPSPVGLAAGLDKNAQAIDFFSRLPFGAIEVGTVTPKPQSGNPTPRLWRYPKEEALRNQMGFNNEGVKAMAFNLYHAKRNGKIIGVNLGKNKETPENKAIDDYVTLYNELAPLAHYAVINVSSPNTPGLRHLQNKNFLLELFSGLKNSRVQCPRDLYLKIAPDLTKEQIREISEAAIESKITGLIATNTTSIPEWGPGGVSGRPLYEKAREVRRQCLFELKNSGLEFIGVGGFSSFSDVVDYWKEGGRAIQIYSAFIYQGPLMIKKIHQDTLKLIKSYGLRHINELFEYLSKT